MFLHCVCTVLIFIDKQTHLLLKILTIIQMQILAWDNIGITSCIFDLKSVMVNAAFQPIGGQRSYLCGNLPCLFVSHGNMSQVKLVVFYQRTHLNLGPCYTTPGTLSVALQIGYALRLSQLHTGIKMSVL